MVCKDIHTNTHSG